MKTRVLALALVLLMALAACSGPDASGNGDSTAPSASAPAASGDAQAPAAGEPDLSEELTITVTRRGNVREVTQEDMFAPFLKEKFNVVLEVTDINEADYVTRMNLMFASGEATDLSLEHRPTLMLNEWTVSGYLRGFTLEEVQQKLPNYIAHYEADAWPVVWENIVHSDGMTYYLPGRRANKVNMAWMYREDIFSQYNLNVPETTDELFDTLMTLKQETGMIPVISSGEPIWAFTGFYQAFGMPELSPNDISYVNPKTGEFVPYAFSGDNFRRMISYMNKLYENDLIWKEFATATEEQQNKLQSEGNGFLMWGYPDAVDTDYNPLSQAADPNASWAWSDTMLTENPDNGHFFKRDPYFAAGGVGFNVDAEDAVVDRFLYMLNWFYSDEGMAYRTFGVEGVHYEKQGDNYVFMDQMASPTKPDGLILENYGFLSLSAEHENQNEYYRPYLIEVANTFLDRENYYFFTKPVQKFTEEESSELADLETNLALTRDEYYTRFIVGQLDIDNDAEWENYISTMNQLGLERVQQIRTEAYERSNN